MLYLSFGSVEAYRRAVFVWKWRAAAYFLLLSIISAVSAVVATHGTIESFYDTAVEPALKQLANVKIENGRVKTPGGADIEMKTRDGKVFAVATENYVDASKTKGLVFAFEGDRATFYMPDGNETFFTLKGYEQMLGKRGVDALFPPKGLLLWGIAPLACFFMFVLPMNAMFLAIMSVAAFILSRTLYPFLTFAQCMKLSLAALTPSVAVDIVSVLAFGSAAQGFVYALVSGGMVFYILKSFAAEARGGGVSG